MLLNPIGNFDSPVSVERPHEGLPLGASMNSAEAVSAISQTKVLFSSVKGSQLIHQRTRRHYRSNLRSISLASVQLRKNSAAKIGRVRRISVVCQHSALWGLLLGAGSQNFYTEGEVFETNLLPHKHFSLLECLHGTATCK